VTTYRVAMAGGTIGRRSVTVDESPETRADAASPVGASGLRDIREPSTWMGVVSHWLSNLPRDVATMLVIAGFLVLINAFTGFHRTWFHWPVAVLLFIVIMRMLRRRGPASD